MRKQLLLLLVIGIGLFGISLLTFIQYVSRTSHFSFLDGFVIPIIGLILSLRILGKTLWLVGNRLLDEMLLRTYEQRIQRHPHDADAYLTKISILMRIVSRDCEKMKYFLSWDTVGTPARDIGTQINKNLERIDTMLQTLDTAYRLNLLSFPVTNVRGATPFEARIARNRLESFNRLFPIEVEKKPFDRPTYLLVNVLQQLCTTIALNPLYTEAFASGVRLMEYIHREESARKFQHIVTCLEQAQKEGESQRPWDHFVTHQVLPAFQEIKSIYEQFDGTTVDIQQAPTEERWVRLTWMVAPSASVLAILGERTAPPPRTVLTYTIIGDEQSAPTNVWCETRIPNKAGDLTDSNRVFREALGDYRRKDLTNDTIKSNFLANYQRHVLGSGI